jgi:hypothetical protein
MAAKLVDLKNEATKSHLVDTALVIWAYLYGRSVRGAAEHEINSGNTNEAFDGCDTLNLRLDLNLLRISTLAGSSLARIAWVYASCVVAVAIVTIVT